jgi:hypothetical protein
MLPSLFLLNILKMNNTKVNGIEFPSNIRINENKDMKLNDLKFIRDITTGRHSLEGDVDDVDILLTVPHGFCLPVNYRMCDINALPVADLLEVDFKKVSLKVLKFVSTLPRAEVDLNRAIGRGKLFRSVLTRWLRLHSNSNKHRWFIDVHSFPMIYSEDLSETTWKSEYANQADLVILDDYPQGPAELHIMLHDFLIQHGFQVAILPGAINVNDINLEENQTLKDSNTLVSLLEFNESLQSNKLPLLCNLIVDFWINRMK